MVFSDNEDEAVELLRQIARNTGSLDEIESDVDAGRDVTIETQSIASRTGVIEPDSYVIQETSDLDAANTDGTVTAQPGEEVVLAEWRPDFPFGLIAVGATDAADVEYAVVVDHDKTVGGWLGSPLGTLNSPFSFVEELGGAVSCQKSVKYLARLDGNASSSVDLAARIHNEVMA